MASAAATPATTIALRSPSRYASSRPSSAATSGAFAPPPVDWLHRTWSVTHSTLSMWRSKRNVRITYSPLPPKEGGSASTAAPRIDDLVEYESASGRGGVKSVAGVDTAASSNAPAEESSSTDTSAWDWRGKGWLAFVSSHWEVLGWGERPLPDGEAGGGAERWVVTWFAPTLFTKEGVDIYSDRREGGSKETVDQILAALKSLDAKPVVDMCEKNMQPVQISLPWKEK